MRGAAAAFSLMLLFACGRARRVRPTVDQVGYTHSAAGIAKVVAAAAAAEHQPTVAAGEPLLGAISPHDDYVYAARVYVHAFPALRARDVVVIGVAHKARDYPEVEGKLVFDSFDAWQGPYGDVAPSPLRADLLARLPAADVRVDDRFQKVEHSVEGLVPFLQHYDREARLVSILVPTMTWPRLAALADETAAALAGTMQARGLALGRDVAILISADLIHYGDEGWNGRTFADLGVSGAAYDRAVERDRALIRDHLEGEIALPRLESLYHALVQDDPHEYRVTWCGRFSIPFGLALLAGTAQRLGLPAPRGELLRQATTLDPGREDPGVPGLGATAPANIHHWVGFAAVGYR